MIRVFFSYSHVDEKYRNELEKHLKSLQRQGLIESWHDRRISAGEDWANRIDQELRHADIILLLVSSDFINSDYCYELEMREALARHEREEAVVIPVIVRPCHWTGLPFGKLQAATQDGKPVEKYPSLDDAFVEVTQKIEAVAKDIASRQGQLSSTTPRVATDRGYTETPKVDSPRSSNLAIPRVFTDHDKDTYIAEAFNYIANFFESSLKELEKRYPDISYRFERVDARTFEAAIYRNGNQSSRCGIWLGNTLSGWTQGPESITFSLSGIGQRNSFNEQLSITEDSNSLGLKAMGFGRYPGGADKTMTNNGAAEHLWSMFFEPMKHRA